MEENKSISKIEWARFFAGVVLFLVLTVIDAAVKEVSIFVFAIPGALMGVDAIKIYGGLKK